MMDWREYQKMLQREQRSKIKRRTRWRMPLWGRLAFIIIVIVCAGYAAFTLLVPPKSISARHIDNSTEVAANETDTKKSNAFTKKTLRQMLASIDPNQMAAETLMLENNGSRYTLKTSIAAELQNGLVDQLRLEHARFLSIVVLDPKTGRILTMISHDRLDPNRNTCMDNHFPAASIFKIITASAAIEAFELDAHSPMIYNGRKHTLYKSQLKELQNKWTRRIPFEDAFAQSVNPVFGKLGANRLGKERLLSYAHAFGFNHEFDLDLPMAPSRFAVSDAPYHWAEIASGFNQETTLSPLHGAIIAASVVNAGQLIEPTLVDTVMNDKGQTVYRARTRIVQKAMEVRTAQIISKMMHATVTTGTARKIFRGYNKDRVLAKLEIGGKTGSINNDPRYDWYVGFATEKESDHSVVVSVLVAHEKFIRIKSGQYARMAIKAYFENYFAVHAALTPSSANPLKNG